MRLEPILSQVGRNTIMGQRMRQQDQRSQQTHDLNLARYKQQMALRAQEVERERQQRESMTQAINSGALGNLPSSERSFLAANPAMAAKILGMRIQQRYRPADPLRALRLKQEQLKLQALEQKVNGVPEGTVDPRAVNIHSGLQNLADVPNWASDNDYNFEGTIGGFDNSKIGRIRDYVSSTGTVRAKIAGDVEALSAAIKPLIRAKGEGAWTDADQRRLVSIIGDLHSATDVNDYNTRLDAARQRIISNFGIDIPQLNFEGKSNPKFDRSAIEAEMKRRGLLN